MRKKQSVLIFRDSGVKVLRFVYIEIVSHLAQNLFFLHKKVCQTKFSDLGQ